MAKKQPARYRLRIVDWSAFDRDAPDWSWYLETNADENGRTGPGWQCLMWHQGTEHLAKQVAAPRRDKGIEVIEEKRGAAAG